MLGLGVPFTWICVEIALIEVEGDGILYYQRREGVGHLREPVQFLESDNCGQRKGCLKGRAKHFYHLSWLWEMLGQVAVLNQQHPGHPGMGSKQVVGAVLQVVQLLLLSQ